MDLFLFSDIEAGNAIALQQQLQVVDDSETINVHINSQGGSVTEGISIIRLLKSAPNPVNTHIVGLAASMSSAIAMVGDRVTMSDGSLLMIHNARFSSGGEASTMRANADIAEALSDSLASIYVAKTKKGKKEIKALMNAETVFTAKEALKQGFVDQVVQPMAVAAKFDIKSNNDMNLKEEIINLGNAIIGKEDDATKEIIDQATLDATDKIVEEIENAVSPADVVTAELVKNEDYLVNLDLQGKINDKFIAFVEHQKSNEELTELLKTVVREELNDLLKNIKSKAVVPVGGAFEKKDAPLNQSIPQQTESDIQSKLQAAIDHKNIK